MKFFKRVSSAKLSTVNLPQLYVLNSVEDYAISTKKLEEINLKGHHDPQKNWDLYLSIYSSQFLDKKAKLLDAGSGSKAVYANSMAELGFKNSYACDLQRAKGSKILSSIQDIAKTNFDKDFFDFIACHSVIEHGVDLHDFLLEMYRITKPRGSLAISTDFWPEFEDHSSKYPYGNENPPMMLFNNESIGEFLEIAQEVGWKIPEFRDSSLPNPRPVYWPRMDAWFTFIWLLLVK